MDGVDDAAGGSLGVRGVPLTDAAAPRRIRQSRRLRARPPLAGARSARSTQ